MFRVSRRDTSSLKHAEFPGLHPWRHRLAIALVASALAVLLGLAGLWIHSYWAQGRLVYGRESLTTNKTTGRLTWAEETYHLQSGFGLVALVRVREVHSGKTKAEIEAYNPYVGNGLLGFEWRPVNTRLLSWFGERVSPWHTLRWSRFDSADGVPSPDFSLAVWNLVVPYWVLMLPWIIPPVWWLCCPPGRPWPRLTVRRLIVLAAASVVVLAGFAAFWRASAEDRALGLIKSNGCYWICNRDGIVNSLMLNNREITDADLSRIPLARMSGVKVLSLSQSSITDTGLVYLRKLPGLERLFLGGTSISDAGLVHLAGLSQLRDLNLRNTNITDNGLANLRRLTRLRVLDLEHTRVTPSGVEKLQRALPGAQIQYDSRSITGREKKADRTHNDDGDLRSPEREKAAMAHPVVPGDTTPIGAMKALQAAFRAGDEVKIRFLTRAKTREQRRALSAKNRGWAQIGPFIDALYARFEQNEVNEHFMSIGLMFATQWIDADNAVAEIAGESATISDGHHAQKLIREDGHWKVYFDDWNNEYIYNMMIYAEPLAKAMEQTTPEIRAGKYKTLKELDQVFQERVKTTEPPK